MVDKVKPLKLENPQTGGTEENFLPTETDPAEDYVSAKGLSFEHSDSYLIDIDPVTKELRYKDGVTNGYVKFNQIFQTQHFETLTVSAQNVTNQYIQTTYAMIGIPWVMIEGLMLRPNVDFSVSPSNRINFINSFASGGDTAFSAGDVIHVWYMRSISN